MRFSVTLRSALLAAVIAGILGQGGDDKVRMECSSGANAPQCPSGTTNGVLLVAKTTAKTGTSTSNTVSFSGNLSQAYAQALAFRRGRAPAYAQGIAWSSSPDTVALTYDDRLQVPVKIWVVCPVQLPDGSCAPLSSGLRQSLSNFRTYSNSVLNSERVGLRLVAADQNWIADETQTNDLTGYRDFDDGQCEALYRTVSNLSPKKIVDRAINVYVVRNVNGSPGYAWECMGKYLAVAGSSVDWTTLLHEIGHSLSLEDIDPRAGTWDYDPVKNFMYSNTSSGREFFTEGQTFRIHFNRPSFLNAVLGLRTNEQRYCGITNQDAEKETPPCPKLEARIWADQ